MTGEEADVVEEFVKRQGSKMEYTVAVDQRDGSSRAWMQAAGRNGIPSAFLVAQNKIAWIGNPYDKDFESSLAEIVGGRYDPELKKAAEPLMDQIDYAVRMQDWRAADDYFARVIELSPWVFNEVAIKKFKVWVLQKKDIAGAIEYAQGEFLTNYRDDPETIAKLATTILTDSRITNAAPDQLKPLALMLAETVANGDGRDDPDYLGVHAMALYHNGNTAEAVRVAERAYFIADPEDKAEFKKALDTYRLGTTAGRRVRDR